ncbi:hypothetical protein MAR_008693 [Mya arenaria]|uniref:Uncharacterized protein n=1 Tax=Mya arenaria TaxID=6604 RepID=A0ABY7DWN0_MYAAR|nr:hypothetical protein MAR_008693 [Mya arenaria]
MSIEFVTKKEKVDPLYLKSSQLQKPSTEEEDKMSGGVRRKEHQKLKEMANKVFYVGRDKTVIQPVNKPECSTANYSDGIALHQYLTKNSYNIMGAAISKVTQKTSRTRRQ